MENLTNFMAMFSVRKVLVITRGYLYSTEHCCFSLGSTSKSRCKALASNTFGAPHFGGWGSSSSGVFYVFFHQEKSGELIYYNTMVVYYSMAPFISWLCQGLCSSMNLPQPTSRMD